MTTTQRNLEKRSTGIIGLDHVTRGGLPAAGATLILGGPGAGKTVLCLQILANSVADGNDAVIVSFEESDDQIRRDACSFNWGNALLDSDRCRFIDARPPVDVVASGNFDLEGIKSLIENSSGNSSPSWIVLDGIDQLLRMLEDPQHAVKLIAGLNQWSKEQQMSLLLTGKDMGPGRGYPAYLDGVEFIIDTVLGIPLELIGSRLNRRFRIEKYRGSAHVTDELPMVMDDDGLHLPFANDPAAPRLPVRNERCSTGVSRLDRILGGGINCGSTVLLSGQPGTSKTTLAATIANAAAERGERVLYVSFDELEDHFLRNVASVGIRLGPHIESGKLHMISLEAWRMLLEEHYIAISRLFDDLKPDWLMIDPVSALMKANSAEGSRVSIERILGMARAQGVTTVMTSLCETDTPESEGTLSHASTLADTWISLSYNIRSGERNRALSVVKSRGTAHSNQVHEMILSSDGIDLADVYQFGTEVLMGTARLQKENEEIATFYQRNRESQQRKQRLERELEQAQLRLKSVESEVKRLQESLDSEQNETSQAEEQVSRNQQSIIRKRAISSDSDRNPVLT